LGASATRRSSCGCATERDRLQALLARIANRALPSSPHLAGPTDYGAIERPAVVRSRPRLQLPGDLLGDGAHDGSSLLTLGAVPRFEFDQSSMLRLQRQPPMAGIISASCRRAPGYAVSGSAPIHAKASRSSESQADGRRIRMSPVRSRRSSSLPAVIGYHCFPHRRGGTCRRFNSRDTAL
jgi:hypothetical protein